MIMAKSELKKKTRLVKAMMMIRAKTMIKTTSSTMPRTLVVSASKTAVSISLQKKT